MEQAQINQTVFEPERNFQIPTSAVFMGEGLFNWPRNERVSDRYGSVRLLDSDDPDRVLPFIALPENGAKGRLAASIVATRESGHIGDMFRGFSPRKPNVGENILLGEGLVFFYDDGHGQSVGLSPDDGRPNDWLNPRALYDCHHQKVRLYFVPTED